MTTTVRTLAVPSAGASFETGQAERRDPGPRDVAIDIAYCGICHSDIHQARDEWFEGIYPMVPGHEIAGTVSAVGAEVTDFAVGDRVGVGCFVDSCRECVNCRAGDEQYCVQGEVPTYNGRFYETEEPTYGGYSTGVVVDQDFVLRIHDGIGLDAAAPLLCAGITLYSPLSRWGAGPGKKVAIVGMGGLGHMGVKIAAAMGAEVTVLSRSLKKQEDGERLGAHHYYATEDRDTFRSLRGSFDLIVNTVSADLPFDDYLSLLAVGGTMVNVGLGGEPVTVQPFSLVGGRHSLAGSKIGGIRETQEMLDFCAEHGLGADIEVVPPDPAAIDAAWDRVVDGDVRYRFVIDLQQLGD